MSKLKKTLHKKSLCVKKIFTPLKEDLEKPEKTIKTWQKQMFPVPTQLELIWWMSTSLDSCSLLILYLSVCFSRLKASFLSADAASKLLSSLISVSSSTRRNLSSKPFPYFLRTLWVGTLSEGLRWAVMSICPSSGPRPASAPPPLHLLVGAAPCTAKNLQQVSGKAKPVFPAPHLRGEHGDVVKLSTAPLFHRHRQEESAAVFGEHRFLVLEDTQKQMVKIPHTWDVEWQPWIHTREEDQEKHHVFGNCGG